MLSKSEAFLIAGIVNDPAYILLMEKIQAGIEGLTDRLHVANREETADMLSYWRAMRTIYFELKNSPEQMAQYLEDIRIHPDIEPLEEDKIANHQLNDFLNNSNRIRAAHDQTLEDLLPQESTNKWQNNSLGNFL
jgi:hypothetical protein